MKKFLTYILIVLFLPLSLFGADMAMPKLSPPVSVKMVGVIPPREVQIFFTDESDRDLSAEDAVLNFDFPETEEWEVSQSIQLSYSSHLSKEKTGWLAFRIEELGLDDTNALQISLELMPTRDKENQENVSLSTQDTFQILFKNAAQNRTPIGTLTVKIQKHANMYFSPGPFTGILSMSYIEGN